ncbi:hypothetical protein CLAFUW4_08212 [Fulvia fulva]|uniref:F-box domain-containing protein n=1 Tax=Passalora fulva TaxID=5499 RepID=A0A9Q8P6S2_PASFU|nr:uncharacterized protein CLAFUR5_08324 [Fulvia fulva]KAK4629401.1 hypothetical protein CLAFUR4_08217 [Fulvia fulva]KAK4630656.1 hypothetical protein CLAFUR0_08212 [Fulvia fulva]UJO15435.1 hypothetical protein CLAFUR5_08324 [Fulvia fulva]WPV12839.1 hypothetical protein CLAFUW4_08212 [Fulvia fulva]WPV27658.1 hypothetical protein CLAFUW7_08212 [Fulvia fulva]
MAAPTSTTQSPGDKVSKTTEILESILLEVNDMQTILLSQRVSKSFNATIHGSFKLRRILWFEPTPSAEQDESFPKINPLLAKCHTNANIQVLTTGIMAQNRTDMLGNYNYVEVRVMARKDESSWMRMLPFQIELKGKWALACPFVCDEREGREQPAKWTFRDEKDDIWLAPEHSEEYVGKGVWITKCTMLGQVKKLMTIREMFEAADNGVVAEREPRLSL